MMRIIELEINNMRGIKYLVLKPDGKNFVVWGPNGSGKSAVVDSIDFLLTGRISRLTGAGTRGISLNKHGPHIDLKPKDATVNAIIKFPNLKEPVKIKRSILNPNVFECDPTIKDKIEPILELAKRGQHVLTRRDILKFITSEASTRAKEIQSLLNITEIENIRSNIVTVKNRIEENLEYLKKSVDQSKESINVTANLKEYKVDLILDFINLIGKY